MFALLSKYGNGSHQATDYLAIGKGIAEFCHDANHEHRDLEPTYYK